MNAKTTPAAQPETPLDAEEIRCRIYADIARPDFTRVLTRYALTLRNVSRDDAKDYVQDAIELEWNSATRTWNPAEFERFTDHCKMLIRRAWRRKHRHGAGARELSYASNDETLTEVPSRGPSPEKLASMADGGNKANDSLRRKAEAKGDTLVVQILELREGGELERPAEFAAALDRPVKDINRAFERLDTLEEAVAREHGERSVLDMLAGAVPRPAPGAVVAPAEPRSSLWAWAWLGLHLAAVTGLAGGLFLVDPRAATLAAVLGAVAYAASLVCGVLWVRAIWSKVWRGMNFDQRGKELSAAKAALLFFVPGFNVYWMFRMHALVVEAIERMARSSKLAVRGSKALAVLACALTLVPGVNLVVAPVVWAMHMFRCERAFALIREAARASD